MNILKRAAAGAAVLVMLAVAAGPACAQATQASAFADTPLYAGVTAGEAHWRVGCYDTAHCDDVSRSLRVLGGWQINKYLAAEIGFHNFHEITSPGFFVKAHAWEYVVLPQWPISESWYVYGKAGGFRGSAENNNTPPKLINNFSYTFGAGIGYELTRNLGVRLEWQSYQGISGDQVSPRSDIDVASIGVLWRFR
jgi:OOP family OmpA-OmpF porin